MDIFCEKCQKQVGRIADEKIPGGRKLSVGCPRCGEKIYFEKPEEFSGELDFNDDSIFAATPIERGEDPSFPSGASGKSGDDYDFSIMEIIREAWARTSGTKGPVWGGVGLAVLAVLVFSMVVAAISSIVGGGPLAAGLQGAARLTISLAGYPFMAGLVLVGIRRAVGLPVNYRMVFSCFSMMLPIVIASLLTSILTMIGFFLLVIPGIYLSIAYTLVIHLIVDKEMGPWQAMEGSRKAVQRHWFKVLGLYILMTLICLISALPMGLGLIWTIPMFFMVGGILYREVFGVTQEI
ncbi:MAG: hypothetical protein P1P81_07435 [Desulfobulbales bacterium]|nr:hypothetical protein [Desulfobulbales bacterium]